MMTPGRDMRNSPHISLKVMKSDSIHLLSDAAVRRDYQTQF